MGRPEVGVLALQGDFARHSASLDRLGVEVREVRKADEFEGLTHLVLPGGESTTLLKLMGEWGIEQALRSFRVSGRPMLATCAGVILLARKVSGPTQPSLGLLDVAVERNAYGRQLASFITRLGVPCLGPEPFEAVFIRAPVIREASPEVEVLASHAGHPVLVREGPVLAATFHPELADDTRVHEAFLALA